MITHIHVPRRRLLTVKQVMRMFNVDEDTVNEWSQHGLIKRYEVGNPEEYRLAEAEVKSVVTGSNQNNRL